MQKDPEVDRGPTRGRFRGQLHLVSVALASLKPLVDSKTFTFITNAGASQIAGELCSPYVFSTSWQNDQTPQTVGLYMNRKT